MSEAEGSTEIVTAWTSCSVYDIEMDGRCARRITSDNQRLLKETRGLDAVGWKQFHSVSWHGYGLMFVWGLEDTDDGAIVRRTSRPCTGASGRPQQGLVKGLMH